MREQEKWKFQHLWQMKLQANQSLWPKKILPIQLPWKVNVEPKKMVLWQMKAAQKLAHPAPLTVENLCRPNPLMDQVKTIPLNSHNSY